MSDIGMNGCPNGRTFCAALKVHFVLTPLWYSAQKSELPF